VKRLRWDRDDDERGTLPKHPYRDTAIVYAVMALIVIGLTALTGGSVVRSVVIAALVYVVATAWSWLTWRRRLRDVERKRSAP
jgi:uncharacterized membrane protein YhaH (DUF805 family)